MHRISITLSSSEPVEMPEKEAIVDAMLARIERKMAKLLKDNPSYVVPTREELLAGFAEDFSMSQTEDIFNIDNATFEQQIAIESILTSSKINIPIIKPKTQIYKLESVNINKNNNELTSTIIFGIYDEKNVRISSLTKMYKGEEFNTFWENFNTSKCLYEEVTSIEKINLLVPKKVEDDFKNIQK